MKKISLLSLLFMVGFAKAQQAPAPEKKVAPYRISFMDFYREAIVKAKEQGIQDLPRFAERVKKLNLSLIPLSPLAKSLSSAQIEIPKKIGMVSYLEGYQLAVKGFIEGGEARTTKGKRISLLTEKNLSTAKMVLFTGLKFNEQAKNLILAALVEVEKALKENNDNVHQVVKKLEENPRDSNLFGIMYLMLFYPGKVDKQTKNIALLYASKLESPDIIEYLFPDYNQIEDLVRDKDTKMTALMYAAQQNNLATFELIYNKLKGKYNPRGYHEKQPYFEEKSKEGMTILDYAIQTFFTSKGKKVKVFDYILSKESYSFLSLEDAAKKGELLQVKMRFNMREKPSNDEIYHALEYAIENGHLPVVKFFIENKFVGIDEKKLVAYFQAPRTPLMVAASYGKEDIVTYLLEKGASVSIQDNHKIPAWMFGAMSNNEHIFVLLFQNSGQFINFKTVKEGYSALLIAAKYASEKVVDYILNKSQDRDKVEVNIQDNTGMTPMMHLVEQEVAWRKTPPEIISVLQLLLDKGADLNIRDNKGFTVLDYRIKKLVERDQQSETDADNDEVRQFLKRQGAKRGEYRTGQELAVEGLTGKKMFQ